MRLIRRLICAVAGHDWRRACLTHHRVCARCGARASTTDRS